MKIKNNAGENPYIYDCPWCGAKKGGLCKDLQGIEYIDGTYHRARLMLDCLEGNGGCTHYERRTRQNNRNR